MALLRCLRQPILACRTCEAASHEQRNGTEGTRDRGRGTRVRHAHLVGPRAQGQVSSSPASNNRKEGFHLNRHVSRPGCNHRHVDHRIVRIIPSHNAKLFPTPVSLLLRLSAFDEPKDLDENVSPSQRYGAKAKATATAGAGGRVGVRAGSGAEAGAGAGANSSRARTQCSYVCSEKRACCLLCFLPSSSIFPCQLSL